MRCDPPLHLALPVGDGLPRRALRRAGLRGRAFGGAAARRLRLARGLPAGFPAGFAAGFARGVARLFAAGALAARLLTEDIGLPATLLDQAAFAREDAARPYVAGYHWGPDPVDARAGVDAFLAGLYAKLVPTRGGPLGVMVLRRVPEGAQPRARLGTAEIVSLVPVALPANLSPPPYRFRVGYQRAHQVQASDLSPRVTDARKSLIGTEFRTAGWYDGDILTAYRRPNDPPPIGGALLGQADAQRVADELGDLWGVQRRLYQVAVPTTVALDLDVGDVVRVSWPIFGLMDGKLGQVVGDQFRSGDAVVGFLVLV